MEFETVVRARRTHKAYAPDPVDRETLDALFDLARWAPNHNLTNPWRFRVLGPRAREALKVAAGPEAAGKLDRAPTLVAVSAVQAPDDAVQAEEDLLASACAAYLVLLGAADRGIASYWRTPAVLRTPAGRAACGIPADERPLGLLHLGQGRDGGRPAPERAPVDAIRQYLA